MVRSQGTHLKPAALIASLALAGLVSSAAVTTAHGAVSGSVSFEVTERRPDVPTGLIAQVTGIQEPGVVGAPLLQRLQVTLPDGVQFGAQARTASGDLQFCDPSAFAAAGQPAAVCPPGSGIGAVQVETQDGLLVGSLYAGPPSPGTGLPSIFAEGSLGGSAEPTASRIKLVGGLSVGADGRLGMLFDQIPRAFSSLRLQLAAGPGALVGTPRACNGYAGLATLTSAATGSVFATASAISIDQDCAPQGFSPSVDVWSDDRQAGAVGVSTLAIARGDRTPRLRTIQASAPSGLLADIGGTPECGLTGEAAAACPGDTRIGSAELTIGVGASPRTITGPIYLTPRASGAVAGGHLAARVRLGALDLGDVVIPIRMDLRPTDAGITLTFDVPDRFRGIDLAVRRVAMRFDRPGFTLNPSSCGPLAFGATITADTGAVTSPGGQITYDRCDARPFAPTLQATLTGETTAGGHPNVNVALNARAGDSNLRSANVVLPTGIAPDVNNIQNSCSLAEFNAVTCSANARVGTATARVSLTPEPIPGDVYLVKVPGEALPGLGLSFTGRFAQRVLGVTRIEPKSQRLIVRFEAIPDLPLRRLDLDIFGGAKGPIKVASGTCPESAVWDASFAAHGPQVSSHTIPATCAPRPAKRSAITLSSTYGLSWRLVDLGGRSLQSAKLTLPAGFAIVKARASRRQYQSVKLAGAAAKLSFTTKAVIVATTGKTTRTLTVRLKAGSVKRTSPLAAKQGTRRVKLKVRLGFTDGTVQNQTITVRAK